MGEKWGLSFAATHSDLKIYKKHQQKPKCKLITLKYVPSDHPIIQQLLVKKVFAHWVYCGWGPDVDHDLFWLRKQEQNMKYNFSDDE